MSENALPTRDAKWIGINLYYSGVTIINMNQIKPQILPLDTIIKENGGFTLTSNKVKIPLDGSYSIDYDVQGLCDDDKRSIAARIMKDSGAVLTSDSYSISNMLGMKDNYNSCTKTGYKLNCLKDDEVWLEVYRVFYAGDIFSVPGQYSLNIRKIED